jgi:hypothetical protein
MSEPTGPNDATDRAWFRTQVEPVVRAEPIPDAWAKISARADGAPAPAPVGRPAAVRWLVAAAVIALLAGVAVVIAATRGDDATSLAANQPADPTGWYIPQGLPQGWTLVTAWVVDDPTLCTKLERSWSETRMVDPGRTLTLTYDACGTTQPGAAPVDPSILGDGVELAAADEIRSKPGSAELRWQTDEGAWKLRLSGLTTPEERRAQLEEAARQVIDNPLDAHAPLPDLTDTGYRYIPGTGTGPTVNVQLRAPSTRTSPNAGNLLTYRLTAPGAGPARDPFSVTEPVDPADVPGQALPLTLRTANWEEHQPTQATVSRSRYLGSWPGADVDVPRWGGETTSAGDVEPEDAAAALEFDTQVAKIEAATLVAALRPATAEQWRAYLATAEEAVDPDLLSAPDVRSVAASPDQGTTTQPKGTPTTTDPEATAATTTTALTPMTTAPEAAPGTDGLESPAATLTPGTDGQPRNRYSDLAGLRVRLRLNSTGVNALQPTTGVLLIENTTDRDITINGCSSKLTRWGVLARGERGKLPVRDELGNCDDADGRPIPAGETAIVPLDAGVYSGFSARAPGPELPVVYLGTLAGGPYTAIAVIPGSTGDIRVELPVTVPDPPCPMTADESVTYHGMSLSAAQAAAERDGRHVAVASEDGRGRGIPWNLDCSRVQVHLEDGKVVHYTFG